MWGIVLTMDFREQPLGKNVRFLLPSLKLKEPCPGGGTIEQSVHAFLVEHFGGYTAGSATVAGYWREEDGSQYLRRASSVYGGPAR